MLRLVVLFGFAGYTALLLAGEDRGQLRPGLASAVASGQEITILERDLSANVPAPAAPVKQIDTPPPPVEMVQAVYTPPAPAPAAKDPEPAPIFTLSTLPTIGGDVADPAPVLEEAAATPAAPAGDARTWVVVADSVNVRQGPSTDMGVIDRLTSGEMVTVIAQDGDWAHILVEGDGIDGYVAARFLTPAY